MGETKGKTGSCSNGGGAMLSKSLIQFSFDGWSCVPSLLFTLGPNCGGGNEDNGDLLKRSHAGTAAQCPQPCLRPAPAHASSGDCWTLMGKSGQSFVGSLLFSPGSWCTQILFVPSKSLFPQFCVSSGSSMVGLMATSSKRAYALPKSDAPRAPASAAVHS